MLARIFISSNGVGRTVKEGNWLYLKSSWVARMLTVMMSQNGRVLEDCMMLPDLVWEAARRSRGGEMIGMLVGSNNDSGHGPGYQVMGYRAGAAIGGM